MRAPYALAAALAAIAIGAPAAEAQRRLIGGVEATTGILMEQWSFSAASALGVETASQMTVPFTVVVPLPKEWTLDAYGAFASGRVERDTVDAQGRREYTLSGITDLRLRAVKRLRDELLFTAGVTVPLGQTDVTSAEGQALGILAAPSLRFRTPVLGSGLGATTGIVYAREVKGWAVGLAGSLEYRGTYSPAAAAQAGVSEPSLHPGHAMHLSVAADRTVGQSRRALNLIADLYTAGELRTGASGGTDIQLGPSVTAVYQHQFGSREFESGMYVLERFRSAYSRGGSAVKGTSRSETEAGLSVLMPMRPGVALRFGADARYHTNSLPDATVIAAAEPTVRFANAGVIGATGTLAVPMKFGSGQWAAEPFFRAQAGRLSLGGGTGALAGGAAWGLTFTARF